MHSYNTLLFQIAVHLNHVASFNILFAASVAGLIPVFAHLPWCYSVFPLVHPVYFQLPASSQPLHLPPLLLLPAGDNPPWLTPKISSVLGRFHDRMTV